MKVKGRSLNDPIERDEYGWVDSLLRERGAAPRPREDDESLGGVPESDILRTVLFAFLLGVLACLLIYLAYQVVAGAGRRVFPLMGTLAVFMACGAVACRRRLLLRFLLALGSLCAVALLVDQVAYYGWHQRLDRLATALKPGIQSGPIVLSGLFEMHPTSFRIDPDGIILRFEPPALAWIYHLDSASWLGHVLVTGWYRLLSRVTRGRDLDRVARTIVRPHEVYAISIGPSEGGGPACRADATEKRWALSVDTSRDHRSL